MANLAKSLSTVTLQNTLLQASGIKVEEQINDQPRRVSFYHYCKSIPKPRKDSVLVGLSRKTCQLIGIDFQQTRKDPSTADYLSGTKRIPQSIPIAHNYCGYQFGVWAGQLGDGRAHTLGAIKNNGKHYQLQLKGSGKSPFSRHADGNSVVSSAVRQFFASQLMAGLGIPTSRALSLVIADEDVVRDPFYNGKIKTQKAAIVLRVISSFLRFGSFQVCKQGAQCDFQDNAKNRIHLKAMADFLLERYYTNIDEQEGDPYQQMFQRIVIRSAQLVAHWQAIGFVHGVLNTDNMSMLGDTIDYGPFAFIDYFSKDYVSNLTDDYERYSYRQQPSTVKWNLTRLAESFDYLAPFSILDKIIQKEFEKTYKDKYYSIMSEKLSIEYSEKNKQAVNKIIDALIEVMHECGTHYTNCFKVLQECVEEQKSIDQIVQELVNLSCPKQLMLQNIRAFQNLLKVGVKKVLQQDSGFNPYFVSQQMIRISRKNKLIHQDCKSKAEYQSTLWKNWLEQYLPHLKQNKSLKSKSIKYVLLNQVASKITNELSELKSKEQKQQLVARVLQVFDNPCQKNEWFQQKYWSKHPHQIKLTCSS